MNHWLVKFAPFRYSWEDVLRNGSFEIYSVRNAQARNNLKKMRLGDRSLFYHSQKGNCVMGVMKVIREAHQDPTTTDVQWLSVTFEPVESLATPIPLSAIKNHSKLGNIGLIRQPRLSVMELVEIEYKTIVGLGSGNTTQ